MDLKLIIGVVIVVIILYLIWSYFFTSVKVLMSFQNASTMNCISGKDVSQSGLNNYSFSTWVYIGDWSGNYGHAKNIITIRKKSSAVDDSTNLFRLYLDRTRNDLHIYVNSSHSGPEKNQSTCSVTNFPVQSWVNISISVYNRAVDVYIDGKLVKTCPLPNVADAIDAGSTIYIGGGSGGSGCSGGSDLLGFTGYIASVLYNPDIISPQDAWNTYARGYSNSPLGLNNLFQRYKLEFAFLKDNNVIKSFKI
jgi:hypothetical protein